jgi:hypothetical protein
MNINYLTLGYDCSPSGALKGLNLRQFALPFDYVISNVNILENCFISNFDKYHKNLIFNNNKTRLIDYYGFEFPHDYPLNNMIKCENINEEDIFISEENSKQITDNWNNYYNIVLEKYNRRIERFKNIIKDTKPIIVLCRYCIQDLLKLQKIFNEHYKIENIYFVNSSPEIFENDKIINIYTEKNNIWNETDIWRKGVNDIKLKIN